MADDAVGEVSIRPAQAADMERMGAYGAALMAMHHEWDRKRFIAARSGTPSAYAGWLARQLQDPAIVLLVAEDNGLVVGYTQAALEGNDYMSLRGPAGVINDIFIDPDWRKKGIGRRLLAATIGELEARGATQVVLSTAYANHAAQAMFASAGFRPTMVEMTRTLTGNDPPAIP